MTNENPTGGPLSEEQIRFAEALAAAEKKQEVSVHVHLMITHDMERRLASKGLTQPEIDMLTPESADFLLDPENNFPERENLVSENQKVEAEKKETFKITENDKPVEMSDLLTPEEKEILGKKVVTKPTKKVWPKMTQEEKEAKTIVPEVLVTTQENPSDKNKDKKSEGKKTKAKKPETGESIKEEKKPELTKEMLAEMSMSDRQKMQSDKREKVLSVEELMTQEQKKSSEEREKLEYYGYKDTSIKRSIANGALDTIGTMFGARLAWELPKLISSSIKKGGAKGATIELLNALKEKNKLSNAVKENFPNNKTYKVEVEEGKKESFPVREKIEAFNNKLRDIKLPEAEKKELRHQMAIILNDHRHFTEEVDKKRVEKVSKVFDVFANDSVQKMTVARETLNTVSIVTAMPWIRGLGYIALAGAGLTAKASNDYDKKYFNDKKADPKEKLAYISKALTIDSAKETYDALIGNFYKKNEKGEKMSFGKALTGAGAKAISLFFGAVRIASVTGFGHALMSGDLNISEGRDKIMESLKSSSIGEELKNAGANWLHNVGKISSFIGQIPGLITNFPHAVGDMINSGSMHTNINIGDHSQHIEQFSAEVLNDATINKGEGIIHTFQRQIEHNPTSFGYHGDIHDHVALHKFAQSEGYKIAVEDGYVKSDGSEVRILDTKNPIRFILHTDHTVTEVNTQGHEYNYKSDSSAEVSKLPNTSEFDRVQDVNHRIEDIYKSDSILPSQPEEWDRVRHLQARDFLAGHFGTPVGELDMVEVQDRIQLQDYIKELESKTHLIPGKNEPIETFILRANKIHSLDMTSIAGFKEYKKYIDKLLDAKKHIENIYKGNVGPFEVSQIDEWKVIGHIRAADILEGKFGNYVGHSFDNVEIENRHEIQEYLKELLKKTHVLIKHNESARSYIARANGISLKDFINLFKK